MSKWEKWFLMMLIISSVMIPTAKNNIQGIAFYIFAFICGLLFIAEKGEKK